jgi:NTP pyrophosphatase (non-canonical NTP hydrolase)
MDINHYQSLTDRTAIYPGCDDATKIEGLLYTTLGMCGESGEFADKVKKVLRDSNGIISEETRLELAKEAGDVLWYIAQCAKMLGFSLETIAFMNIQKLENRKEKNKLKGSGDNR